jgi:protein-tyrosine phosphatase
VIDLHFHCLPGVDDGPADWEEAVALCRLAARQGTTAVVATPHVFREPWINGDRRHRDRLVAELNARLGGEPIVLAGCEYYFSNLALELVERGASGPLTGVNRGRYLLLEFAPVVPPGASAVFHELAILGAVPLIAHPERNADFVREPARLARLVARGALVQLTAGSFLGDFGAAAQGACEEFLRRGLAHVVASDAHSLDQRPPRLAAARAEVQRRFGSEVATALFEANPAAIAASEPLAGAPAPRRSRTYAASP